MKKGIMGAMATVVVALSLVAGGAGSATAAAGKATLWVLHGVPGAKVDVCVNRAEVKSNFTYGQQFSASLPAGSYRVSVRAAASGTCTGAIILYAHPTLKAGGNYTAVAGLGVLGKPSLFLFKNDVRKTAAGAARLSIRHTAAAPRVDVWADGSKLISGLRWGASSTMTVPRGSYRVAVAPAGTTTIVIGPQTFKLAAGQAYQVYATGSAKAGYRFQVIAQPATA
jgi:hypothetical protein